MEDPQAEIPKVIHLLTQSTPTMQRATIEKYFTTDASFTHPFCRTGSFDGSRWLIWCIYRWYKIMSPRIEIQVNSVAFDATNLILYVSIHQLFRIWAVPFFSANVNLVTVLHLAKTPLSTRQNPVYLITSQNDLYQVNEFVKFVSLFGILSWFVYAWQLVATLLCVVGAGLLWPISWVEQRVLGGNHERSLGKIVKG